jgi:hypothetical protein
MFMNVSSDGSPFVVFMIALTYRINIRLASARSIILVVRFICGVQNPFPMNTDSSRHKGIRDAREPFIIKDVLDALH